MNPDKKETGLELLTFFFIGAALIISAAAGWVYVMPDPVTAYGPSVPIALFLLYRLGHKLLIEEYSTNLCWHDPDFKPKYRFKCDDGCRESWLEYKLPVVLFGKKPFDYWAKAEHTTIYAEVKWPRGSDTERLRGMKEMSEWWVEENPNPLRSLWLRSPEQVIEEREKELRAKKELEEEKRKLRDTTIN